MPRWASRITLDVTDVRFEPLKDISDDDAVAEGIAEVSANYTPEGDFEGTECSSYADYGPNANGCFSGFGAARLSFMKLWNSINGKGFVIHGWRYTAAKELAEAGCSDTEIQSVTGHKSLEMVKKYRQQARQKQLSKVAQQRQSRTKTE
jgi:hypothetical protein